MSAKKGDDQTRNTENTGAVLTPVYRVPKLAMHYGVKLTSHLDGNNK